MKAAVPLPTQGGWAGARGWERDSSRGSSGGGSIASSPGDSISRLKFSACPWYRARLRQGQNVSLLACSLPGSSIQEREQTQRVRSPHLPNSQRRPKNPGGHWQMVTFPSRQLPPLRHSQPSESSAREETGASQDPSCLQGWRPHSLAGCHPWGKLRWTAATSTPPRHPGTASFSRTDPLFSPGALNRLSGAAASPSQEHEDSPRDMTPHQRDPPGYSLSRQSCPV